MIHDDEYQFFFVTLIINFSNYTEIYSQFNYQLLTPKIDAAHEFENFGSKVFERKESKQSF
jgi:hypothetical protein